MNYNNLENEFSDYSKLVQLINEYEEMITSTDISAGITAISGSLGLLKRAKDLAENTNNVEIKEIIVSLRDELANTKNLLVDTKEELIDLKNENQSLKEEIDRAKTSSRKLIFDYSEGVYFMEDDYKQKYPMCPHCYENENKNIRLWDAREISNASNYKYSCNVETCRFSIAKSK